MQDGARRTEALRRLKAKPGRSIPGLIEALQDDNPRRRQRIAETLGDLGAKAAPAAEGLSQLLSDRDNSVRLAAGEAIGKIGSSARKALPALALPPEVVPLSLLLQAFEDEDPEVVRNAVKALANREKPDKQDVAVYSAALGSKKVRSRLHALDALRSLGVESLPALPPSRKR